MPKKNMVTWILFLFFYIIYSKWTKTREYFSVRSVAGIVKSFSRSRSGCRRTVILDFIAHLLPIFSSFLIYRPSRTADFLYQRWVRFVLVYSGISLLRELERIFSRWIVGAGSRPWALGVFRLAFTIIWFTHLAIRMARMLRFLVPFVVSALNVVA